MDSSVAKMLSDLPNLLEESRSARLRADEVEANRIVNPGFPVVDSSQFEELKDGKQENWRRFTLH